MSLDVMKISDSAWSKIKNHMSNADEGIIGLRISVEKSGCAGMGYKMDYVSKIEVGDEVIQKDQAQVIIDKNAVLFLIGTEMDYKEEMMSSGFIFQNPNVTSMCGCGESFSFESNASDDIEAKHI